MQDINPIGLYYSFILKSILLTSIIDILINFQPIYYLASIFLLFSLFKLQHLNQLKKGRKIKIIRDIRLTYAFSLLMILMLTYKISAEIKYQEKDISGENWSVSYIETGNTLSYSFDSTICTNLILRKHGIHWGQSDGNYYLNYRFEPFNKLSILSTSYSNLNHQNCSKDLLSDIDILGLYNYKLDKDQIIIKNSIIEIKFIKKAHSLKNN